MKKLMMFMLLGVLTGGTHGTLGTGTNPANLGVTFIIKY